MFDGIGASGTAAVLIAARALIERGWCQGALAKGPERFSSGECLLRSATHFCALGAIHRSVLETRDTHGSMLATVAITKTLGGRQKLTEWNDDPRRRKRQVLALFDRAIEREIVSGRAA